MEKKEYFCNSKQYVKPKLNKLDIDPLPACEPLMILAQAGVTFGAAEIVALVVAAFCLLLSGFVSGSEIAFFSLTPAQIDDLDESPRQQTIRKLLDRPEKLLATILISNNLVNVTIVVLCNFALGPVFANMSPVLSFVLQSVILTFLILLFGEILPKLYSNNYPLKWAMMAAGPLNAMTGFFSPVSRMLVSSTSLVNRVVVKQPEQITTDELTQALEITEVEAGEQRNMLQGILKFGDTTASEIMTPRTDVTDIEYGMTFDEVMKVVVDSGYSRLPVYEGSFDNVKGILYARDLLPFIGRDVDGFDWRSLLRKPYYVPESRMIDDLLEDFRKLKLHLAIVLDEYGGSCGIVTLEDVLEEIVGDINDEYDDDELTYKRLRDNTYVFEGRTLLTDFFRVTGLNEEDYAEVCEDAETLAGMLLAIKGDFPKDKEPLVYGRCRFLILEISDHRINEVRVKVMPDQQQ